MDPRIPHAARLQQQKNYAAAEPIYREILKKQPRNPDALLLLGLLLHETGQHEAAVKPLQQSILIQPNRPESHQTIVGVLQVLGKFPEAIAAAQQVVRLKPLDAEAHFAVAQLMLQVRNHAGALPYARRASELQPRNPAIFVTLSRIHVGLNSTDQALAAVDRALAIDPNFADALVDKGQLLQSQGQLDRAMIAYQAGLKVSPRNLSALNNLGSCLLLKGLAAESIAYFEAAAAVAPESPKPASNIGAALKEMGQIDASIAQFNRAIQLDPDYADAYCNIGSAYATIAEHDKAIAASWEALRVNPQFAAVGSNLLLTILSPADRSLQQVFDEHKAWNNRHAKSLLQDAPPRRPGSRLRVGYLSPDFREHSVRYFIEPIFASHDRTRFEVFAYAAGRRRDEVSDQLAQQVDHWHPVAELTDAQLAELIRSHSLDILVDLAGHTSDNRLLIFASRPAPIQVTYLGYPSTTGMSAIDFRITDWIADPPGAEEFYTEKLIRLPRAFFVYSDDSSKLLDPVLPADRNGFFTFGSFNSFTKINDQTLNAWANILRDVPNSRLLMKARPVDNPSTRQMLLAFFAERGIAADRLDFYPWVTLPQHIAMLRSGIDLMLDTFPYNGHTTSCQSIWMGVPMVTRSGDSFRSRVGETIMHQLNLMDFVARDWAQYEQIAVGLALNPEKLRLLRTTLRQQMMVSTLYDAKSFTRSLEEAYEQMPVIPQALR